MDFLEIRKKAKEQAAAREAAKAAESEERAAAPLAGPSAQGPDGDLPAPALPAAEGEIRPGATPDPVQTDADVLEGELTAHLLGPPAADERFTTWRPGSGAPPRLELAPPVVPEPRQEDFTVVSGLGPALAPPAAPPSAEHRAGVAEDALADFFYRPDEEAPPVPALGAPGEPAAGEDPDSAVREEYLTFLLGGEEYALAIERVREVMKPPPITEVPRAPPHVLGVVTVRGEVVAVFDPRRRLGLPGAAPAEGQGRIVIVDAGEGPCGLLVDAVASVVRLRPGSIEPCPQGIGGASAECLAGIGREADRLFTVLDLGAFLRRAPGTPRRPDEGDRDAGP
jgi:purine-binding chemotaxis protein CheW